MATPFASLQPDLGQLPKGMVRRPAPVPRPQPSGGPIQPDLGQLPKGFVSSTATPRPNPGLTPALPPPLTPGMQPQPTPRPTMSPPSLGVPGFVSSPSTSIGNYGPMTLTDARVLDDGTAVGRDDPRFNQPQPTSIGNYGPNPRPVSGSDKMNERWAQEWQAQNPGGIKGDLSRLTGDPSLLGGMTPAPGGGTSQVLGGWSDLNSSNPTGGNAPYGSSMMRANGRVAAPRSQSGGMSFNAADGVPGVNTFSTRPTPASQPQPSGTSQVLGGWSDLNPSNSIVDEGGFPRVNLGTMYDTAKRGLTEETYNNAADAGFGALRAGPYVASLNQNIGNLQGQMAGKAADLAESEAMRRLQQGMQRESIGSQERMQGAELGSRSSLQAGQLAAQKAMLGMELTSREQMSLQQLREQGRQYDVGIGQRGAEYGSDLAFRMQQAEDQRYQNWLAMLFGGAQNLTEPTGLVVPGGTPIQRPNPFGQLLSPIMSGVGTGIGFGMSK